MLKEIFGTAITTPQQFINEIAMECRPVVLRKLVSHWPVVQAGLLSPAALQEYLLKFDQGLQTEVFFGEPDIVGRYFYSNNMKEFNFDRKRMKFAEALHSIISTMDQHDASSVYVGSMPTNHYLPGFSAQNSLSLLQPSVESRIWLGHAANVSSHYDVYDNIACVVAGKRRFTLFPPEAIGCLYVGPIDNTMAGQPVSLAASLPSNPEQFPLFEAVKDQALTVELEPGDALYLPKLWWHKVESTAPFNALVNYWWDAFGYGPDAPYTSLMLSMIAIAERPLSERMAWRAFFDHYVFRSNGHPLQHLPVSQHGLLGPLKDTYGKIRAHVMHLLRGG